MATQQSNEVSVERSASRVDFTATTSASSSFTAPKCCSCVAPRKRRAYTGSGRTSLSVALLAWRARHVSMQNGTPSKDRPSGGQHPSPQPPRHARHPAVTWRGGRRAVHTLTMSTDSPNWRVRDGSNTLFSASLHVSACSQGNDRGTGEQRHNTAVAGQWAAGGNGGTASSVNE
jgi:hypothetical protein